MAGAALSAALVLVGVALWAVAAGSQESAEPLWSADMTVVEYTSVSVGAATADLFSNVGGSGDLQIKSLWSYKPDRDLRLAFADGVSDAADYTLQVGDLFLEFPAGSSGASSFKWSGVDIDWEDGQLIRVRVVLTADVAVGEAVSVVVNSAATGEPAISGTEQVGETLTAVISAIEDEDGLDSVSYRYQWMRADANIAGATESAYTLGDDEGEAIKLKVSFIDDNGNSETLTSAATQEVRERPQFLVSNLEAGVTGASGVQRTLNVARSGFAQAFTTGPRTVGYPLGSVSIQFTHFFDASTAADDLGVTINGAAGDSGPGDVLCTLVNPSSFSAPGVIAFDAPTGEGACLQLAAETTYFVVIEWDSPSGTDAFALIPQTYPTDESAATAEDPGGADGWSIADHSYYLSVSSDDRTWTAYEETASFKIKVTGTVSQQTTETESETEAETETENNSPTGAPTIAGTPEVEQTLTADTSSIEDADGLTNVSYQYQWTAGGSDIDGATGSSYLLTSSEQGTTIGVRVTFSDDADNTETLTSEATEEVAAAPVRLTASFESVPTTHDGQTAFSFVLRFSEEVELSYLTLRDHVFTILDGETVTDGKVDRARRVTRGSNAAWTIKVTPESNADITIELPATTDCTATEAICARDGSGRKLSNTLSFTVSGPAT
ncbi:hypothetical protein [Candidatus Poriferisodalis sp.]|uniref:hypothetical protein n=1 Tax=Candidatus Poriferisodalis sp. TaxID=3101277 RepID=UPI003B52A905